MGAENDVRRDPVADCQPAGDGGVEKDDERGAAVLTRQSGLRVTHTFVDLEVSQATYDEIAGKLREAGYDHAFIKGGAIDMHGIGLVVAYRTALEIDPEAADRLKTLSLQVVPPGELRLVPRYEDPRPNSTHIYDPDRDRFRSRYENCPKTPLEILYPGQPTDRYDGNTPEAPVRRSRIDLFELLAHAESMASEKGIDRDQAVRASLLHHALAVADDVERARKIADDLVALFVRFGVISPISAPAPVEQDAPDDLSPAERRVIRCLVRGLPNKVIADEIDVTEATVKVHLKSILKKLGLSNRTQAALWAVRNGYGAEPATPQQAGESNGQETVGRQERAGAIQSA